MNATANTRSPWRTRTTTSTGLRIRPPQINARATFIAGRRFRGWMVLLVRFGELALKSRFVRRQLRDRLVANIQDLFAAEGIECLTRADHGRIYVEVDDVPAASAGLRRVFGIVSFSPAPEVGRPPQGPLLGSGLRPPGARAGLPVRGGVPRGSSRRDCSREARPRRPRVPPGRGARRRPPQGTRGPNPRGLTYLPFRSWAPMLGRTFSAPFPLYIRPRPLRPALVSPRNARPRCWGSQIQLIFGSARIEGCCGSTRITS